MFYDSEFAQDMRERARERALNAPELLAFPKWHTQPEIRADLEILYVQGQLATIENFDGEAYDAALRRVKAFRSDLEYYVTIDWDDGYQADAYEEALCVEDAVDWYARECC